MPGLRSIPNGESQTSSAERSLLWIDRVGAFVLCPSGQVVLGGSRPGQPDTADLAFQANLSRRHATITRRDETYVIEPHAPTSIESRLLERPCDLHDGYRLGLGALEIRFKQPSMMSGSARLDVLSGHRLGVSVNGIILLDETCLIGNGAEHHISHPDFPETLVLFVRDGEYYCKARSHFSVAGAASGLMARIPFGAVVEGPAWRFRIEACG